MLKEYTSYTDQPFKYWIQTKNFILSVCIILIFSDFLMVMYFIYKLGVILVIVNEQKDQIRPSKYNHSEVHSTSRRSYKEMDLSVYNQIQ